MGSIGFPVTRTNQSLVAPSSPTPNDTLRLSVIDRVAGLRYLVRSLHVFDGRAGGGNGRTPAKTLREALGKALVDYYPLAGRFVDDAESGETRVASTAEGAWFVEAAAACTLEDVKRLDHPMLIPEEDLLPVPPPDVPALDMPLMMQVTEFTCGGFVVGLITGHAIADGMGVGQFINAVADYARGRPKPRVAPVWERDLTPNPPKMPAPPPRLVRLDLRHFTFDLSPDHVAEAKSRFFEATGKRCSAFDVCVAKTWQARTRAILPVEAAEDDDRPVHVSFFANARHLLAPASAAGFYGNCFYTLTATRPAREVARADLVEVVRVIRDAKSGLADDFARWAAGGFERDPYELTLSYDSFFVSDWTRLGFLEADYGWGTPAHVVPLISSHPFMAYAIIGAPPAPKAGPRVITMCVEERHLPEFKEQVNEFAAGDQH